VNGFGGDLDDADLLACARADHPAFRTGADLDRIDPGALSADERVDLLTLLEEQRRWFEAAQLRVLAVMQACDTSKLGLAQESVSLALQVPLLERNHATEAGDESRAEAAGHAIVRAERQRRRQLTCRTDRDHPPF
jgi:hypothetical protein